MAREKKCPRCAESVKAEAHVCRFCGFEFPVVPKGPKPVAGDGKKILIGVGGLFAIMFAVQISSRQSGPAPTSAVEPTPTAAASDKPDDLGHIAIISGASLKRAARDPDSLVIDDAFGRTEKHGVSYVCITYRARNGFGGMSRDHVVFNLAGGNPSARAWNKFCVGDKDFKDESYAVKSGLSLLPS